MKRDKIQAVTHEYKEVFEHVPSFGRYQKVLFFGCNCLIFSFAFQYMNLMFSFGPPQFHCASANTTCPPNKCCDNCTSYSFDGPFTSIVNEWNLICGRRFMAATIQSLFFGGALVSSLVSGMLTDAFGRKPYTYIAAILVIVFVFASSFANSFILLACLEFFTGYFVAACILAEYSYVMELTGPHHRSMTSSILEVYWPVSVFIYVLIAYFVREWRLLLILTSAPWLVFVIFGIFVPESPRWLITKGRLDQAQAVLTKYAGKKPVDQEQLRAVIAKIRESEIETEPHARKHTVIDLFRTSKMRKWSIIMGYNWFTQTSAEMGFLLFTMSLAGNVYLNVVLMQILPICLLPANILFLHWAGRRLAHISIMSITAVLCLVVMAIPSEYPMVATGIAIVGKGVLSCGWVSTYLIVSELFPTTIRTTALGMSSVCARVGGLVAPYIVTLSQLPGLSLYFPVSIFGGVALLAGIATLWIPETNGVTMAQTIEEAESRTDSYRIPCCGRAKHEAKAKEVEQPFIEHPEVLTESSV